MSDFSEPSDSESDVSLGNLPTSSEVLLLATLPPSALALSVPMTRHRERILEVSKTVTVTEIVTQSPSLHPNACQATVTNVDSGTAHPLSVSISHSHEKLLPSDKSFPEGIEPVITVRESYANADQPSGNTEEELATKSESILRTDDGREVTFDGSADNVVDLKFTQSLPETKPKVEEQDGIRLQPRVLHFRPFLEETEKICNGNTTKESDKERLEQFEDTDSDGSMIIHSLSSNSREDSGMQDSESPCRATKRSSSSSEDDDLSYDPHSSGFSTMRKPEHTESSTPRYIVTSMAESKLNENCPSTTTFYANLDSELPTSSTSVAMNGTTELTAGVTRLSMNEYGLSKENTETIVKDVVENGLNSTVVAQLDDNKTPGDIHISVDVVGPLAKEEHDENGPVVRGYVNEDVSVEVVLSPPTPSPQHSFDETAPPKPPRRLKRGDKAKAIDEEEPTVDVKTEVGSPIMTSTPLATLERAQKKELKSESSTDSDTKSETPRRKSSKPSHLPNLQLSNERHVRHSISSPRRSPSSPIIVVNQTRSRAGSMDLLDTIKPRRKSTVTDIDWFAAFKMKTPTPGSPRNSLASDTLEEDVVSKKARRKSVPPSSFMAASPINLDDVFSCKSKAPRDDKCKCNACRIMQMDDEDRRRFLKKRPRCEEPRRFTFSEERRPRSPFESTVDISLEDVFSPVGSPFINKTRTSNASSESVPQHQLTRNSIESGRYSPIKESDISLDDIFPDKIVEEESDHETSEQQASREKRKPFSRETSKDYDQFYRDDIQETEDHINDDVAFNNSSRLHTVHEVHTVHEDVAPQDLSGHYASTTEQEGETTSQLEEVSKDNKNQSQSQIVKESSLPHMHQDATNNESTAHQAADLSWISDVVAVKKTSNDSDKSTEQETLEATDSTVHERTQEKPANGSPRSAEKTHDRPHLGSEINIDDIFHSLSNQGTSVASPSPINVLLPKEKQSERHVALVQPQKPDKDHLAPGYNPSESTDIDFEEVFGTITGLGSEYSELHKATSTASFFKSSQSEVKSSEEPPSNEQESQNQVELSHLERKPVKDNSSPTLNTTSRSEVSLDEVFGTMNKSGSGCTAVQTQPTLTPSSDKHLPSETESRTTSQLRGKQSDIHEEGLAHPQKADKDHLAPGYNPHESSDIDFEEVFGTITGLGSEYSALHKANSTASFFKSSKGKLCGEPLSSEKENEHHVELSHSQKLNKDNTSSKLNTIGLSEISLEEVFGVVNECAGCSALPAQSTSTAKSDICLQSAQESSEKPQSREKESENHVELLHSQKSKEDNTSSTLNTTGLSEVSLDDVFGATNKSETGCPVSQDQSIPSSNLDLQLDSELDRTSQSEKKKIVKHLEHSHSRNFEKHQFAPECNPPSSSDIDFEKVFGTINGLEPEYSALHEATSTASFARSLQSAITSTEEFKPVENFNTTENKSGAGTEISSHSVEPEPVSEQSDRKSRSGNSSANAEQEVLTDQQVHPGIASTFSVTDFLNMTNNTADQSTTEESFETIETSRHGEHDHTITAETSRGDISLDDIFQPTQAISHLSSDVQDEKIENEDSNSISDVFEKTYTGDRPSTVVSEKNFKATRVTDLKATRVTNESLMTETEMLKENLSNTSGTHKAFSVDDFLQMLDDETPPTKTEAQTDPTLEKSAMNNTRRAESTVYTSGASIRLSPRTQARQLHKLRSSGEQKETAPESESSHDWIANIVQPCTSTELNQTTSTPNLENVQFSNSSPDSESVLDLLECVFKKTGTSEVEQKKCTCSACALSKLPYDELQKRLKRKRSIRKKIFSADENKVTRDIIPSDDISIDEIFAPQEVVKQQESTAEPTDGPSTSTFQDVVANEKRDEQARLRHNASQNQRDSTTVPNRRSTISTERNLTQSLDITLEDIFPRQEVPSKDDVKYVHVQNGTNNQIALGPCAENVDQRVPKADNDEHSSTSVEISANANQLTSRGDGTVIDGFYSRLFAEKGATQTDANTRSRQSMEEFYGRLNSPPATPLDKNRRHLNDYYDEPPVDYSVGDEVDVCDFVDNILEQSLDEAAFFTASHGKKYDSDGYLLTDTSVDRKRSDVMDDFRKMHSAVISAPEEPTSTDDKSNNLQSSSSKLENMWNVNIRHSNGTGEVSKEETKQAVDNTYYGNVPVIEVTNADDHVENTDFYLSALREAAAATAASSSTQSDKQIEESEVHSKTDQFETDLPAITKVSSATMDEKNQMTSEDIMNLVFSQQNGFHEHDTTTEQKEFKQDFSTTWTSDFHVRQEDTMADVRRDEELLEVEVNPDHFIIKGSYSMIIAKTDPLGEILSQVRSGDGSAGGLDFTVTPKLRKLLQQCLREKVEGKSGILSSRAKTMMQKEDPAFDVYQEMNSNKFSEQNPEGNINFCAAENDVCTELLRHKFTGNPGIFEPNEQHLAHYAPAGGHMATKTALHDYITKFMSCSVSEGDLALLASGNAAYDQLCHCLFETDDVLLTNTPTYSRNFVNVSERAGCRLECVPFNFSDVKLDIGEYQKRLEDLTEKGERVRGVILINPHNPLGIIFPEDQVISLCDWAASNNLFVIVDESFSHCIHGTSTEKLFLSFLNKLRHPEKTAWFWSLSKDFGMPGTKISVVHTTNRTLQEALCRLELIHPVSSLVQDFTVNFLSDHDWLTQFHDQKNQRLRRHYEFAASNLRALDLPFIEPVAGIFILVDFRQKMSSDSFAAERELWQRFCSRGVYLTPGQDMHCDQPGWMRLVFSCSKKQLIAGFRRLHEVLGQPGDVVGTIDY